MKLPGRIVRYLKKFEEFNHYFSIYWKLGSLIGLNFNPADKKIEERWFNITKITNLIKFSSFIVIQMFFVSSLMCYIILPGALIQMKLKAVARVIIGMEVIVKGICYSINSREITNILEDLKNLFDNQKLRSNLYLLRNARIIHIDTIYLIFGAIVLTLLPMLVSLLNFMIAGNWPMIFPTEAWFPFDPVEYYVLVYMFHVLAFGSYVTCGAATELMLLMILNHINQQFRCIAEELSVWNGQDKLDYLIKRHCHITE